MRRIYGTVAILLCSTLFMFQNCQTFMGEAKFSRVSTTLLSSTIALDDPIITPDHSQQVVAIDGAGRPVTVDFVQQAGQAVNGFVIVDSNQHPLNDNRFGHFSLVSAGSIVVNNEGQATLFGGSDFTGGNVVAGYIVVDESGQPVTTEQSLEEITSSCEPDQQCLAALFDTAEIIPAGVIVNSQLQPMVYDNTIYQYGMMINELGVILGIDPQAIGGFVASANATQLPGHITDGFVIVRNNNIHPTVDSALSQYSYLDLGICVVSESGAATVVQQGFEGGSAVPCYIVINQDGSPINTVTDISYITSSCSNTQGCADGIFNLVELAPATLVVDDSGLPTNYHTTTVTSGITVTGSGILMGYLPINTQTMITLPGEIITAYIVVTNNGNLPTIDSALGDYSVLQIGTCAVDANGAATLVDSSFQGGNAVQCYVVITQNGALSSSPIDLSSITSTCTNPSGCSDGIFNLVHLVNTSVIIDDQGEPITYDPITIESEIVITVEGEITGVNPQQPGNIRVVPREYLVCKGDELKPEDCDDGQVYLQGQCINKCNANQISVGEICIEREQTCSVVGGTGIQFWASSTYGLCQPRTCFENQGYKLENNVCKYQCAADEAYFNGECKKRIVACPIQNGLGTMTWAGTQYGQCTVASCNEAQGFFKEGNSCQYACGSSEHWFQGRCFAHEQSCPIQNGTPGTQMWTGTNYGTCQVNSCNDGFKSTGSSCISRCTSDQVWANNRCNPLVKSCNIANATSAEERWAGSSYGTCSVVTCAAGFKRTGNTCTSICTASQSFHGGRCFPNVASCPITNGRGTRAWQGTQYGACSVAGCNAGFQRTGNSCITRCSSSQVFSGGQCRPRTISCSVSNGSGIRTWTGSGYSGCSVTSCRQAHVRNGNSCRFAGCGGGMVWTGSTCRQETERESADPLIVDLANSPEGISLSSQLQGVLFNLGKLTGVLRPEDEKMISWTSNPRYGWLVLPDENGEVNSAAEMFGNKVGPDGKAALHGFEDLAKYDGMSEDGIAIVSQPDGFINSHDEIFENLRLWTDLNRDGKSQPDELRSVASVGIESFNLNFDPNFYEVDKYGNKTVFKSEVKFTNGKNALMFDLFFRYFQPVTDDCYIHVPKPNEVHSD